MRLGVISDVHSNVHALDAVLSALEGESIDRLVVLGDLFGYYPWAQRTWQRLIATPWQKTMIKGNHDEMILKQLADPAWTVQASYAASIAQNADELEPTAAPAVLRCLDFERVVRLAGQSVRLVHGTPGDAENGRFYPDDASTPTWLPGAGEWLLLGHTHYPLARQIEGGGWLINPGSVGQPRDGDPRAAFAIVDLALGTHELRRVDYDVAAAQAELRAMGWDERAIRALDKRRPGSLEGPA